MYGIRNDKRRLVSLWLLGRKILCMYVYKAHERRAILLQGNSQWHVRFQLKVFSRLARLHRNHTSSHITSVHAQQSRREFDSLRGYLTTTLA
jgi:hypothetical protein